MANPTDEKQQQALAATIQAEIKARLAFREAYSGFIACMSPKGREDYYRVRSMAKAVAMKAYGHFVAGMTPEQKANFFAKSPQQAQEESMRSWIDAAAGLNPDEQDAYREHEARFASLRVAARREMSAGSRLSDKPFSSERSGASGGGPGPNSVPVWREQSAWDFGRPQAQSGKPR